MSGSNRDQDMSSTPWATRSNSCPILPVRHLPFSKVPAMIQRNKVILKKEIWYQARNKRKMKINYCGWNRWMINSDLSLWRCWAFRTWSASCRPPNWSNRCRLSWLIKLLACNLIKFLRQSKMIVYVRNT